MCCAARSTAHGPPPRPLWPPPRPPRAPAATPRWRNPTWPPGATTWCWPARPRATRCTSTCTPPCRRANGMDRATSPVRVTLEHTGQVFTVQPGRTPERGWAYGFRKPWPRPASRWTWWRGAWSAGTSCPGSPCSAGARPPPPPPWPCACCGATAWRAVAPRSCCAWARWRG